MSCSIVNIRDDKFNNQPGSTITLEFSTPDESEKFISTVYRDKNLRPRVHILFSKIQRLQFRRLRKLLKRPNEANFNILAFIAVFIVGGILWLITSLNSVMSQMGMENVFMSLGLLIVTLSGAFAVIGLPASDHGPVDTLRSIKINCDATVTDKLKMLAETI